MVTGLAEGVNDPEDFLFKFFLIEYFGHELLEIDFEQCGNFLK